MPHTEQSKIDALREEIKKLSALRDRMVNLGRFADHREQTARPDSTERTLVIAATWTPCTA